MNRPAPAPPGTSLPGTSLPGTSLPGTSLNDTDFAPRAAEQARLIRAGDRTALDRDLLAEERPVAVDLARAGLRDEEGARVDALAPSAPEELLGDR